MPTLVRFGSGGTGGGIGSTMVISRTHQGNAAPLSAPLQVGYYQDLVQGDQFSSISLKKHATGVALPVNRSIADRDLVQLDGFALEGLTEYDVEIPFGALKDKLGNVLKGAYRYSFTTKKAYQTVFLVTPEVEKSTFDGIVAEINASGGTIYFTEGEFRGLFPITITHSDVTLSGEGSNTKIICDKPNSGSMSGVIGVIGTSASPIEHVTIEKMTIDGDYSSDTANRNYWGIGLGNANKSVVRDCIIQNNFMYNVSVSSVSNITITGNTVQNCNSYGIDLSTASNCTVTGNTIQNNGSKGIGLSTSNNNTITGNTIQNNNNAGIILSLSSNNNTVTGNTVQNNGSYGIYLASSNNCTVTGNTVQNNANYGIFLSASNNCTVTGNTAQNNSSIGIYLDSISSNCIILANKSYSYGIPTGKGNIDSQNITAT